MILPGSSILQIIKRNIPKVTRHAMYFTFQLAEVAVPRSLFAGILDRITRLVILPPVTRDVQRKRFK